MLAAKIDSIAMAEYHKNFDEQIPGDECYGDVTPTIRSAWDAS